LLLPVEDESSTRSDLLALREQMETENLDIPREDEMEDDSNRAPEQPIDEQAGADANQSAPNQQLIALTPAIQQLLEQSNAQLRGQQQYIVITSKVRF
jgi:hypothetical protein